MTTTINAQDLKTGDTIIGDRTYAAGMLSFTVTKIERIGALVKVHCLSGPYGIERMIAYADVELVTLGNEDRKRTTRLARQPEAQVPA